MRPLSMLRRLAKELCHEEIDAEAVIEEAFIAYARQRLLGFRGGDTLSGGLDMIDMGSATVAGISWDEMLALFNEVGGGLNLNLHLHTLLFDGVFFARGPSAMRPWIEARLMPARAGESSTTGSAWNRSASQLFQARPICGRHLDGRGGRRRAAICSGRRWRRTGCGSSTMAASC